MCVFQSLVLGCRSWLDGSTLTALLRWLRGSFTADSITQCTSVTFENFSLYRGYWGSFCLTVFSRTTSGQVGLVSWETLYGVIIADRRLMSVWKDSGCRRNQVSRPMPVETEITVHVALMYLERQLDSSLSSNSMEENQRGMWCAPTSQLPPNEMQSETADFAPGAATWQTGRNIMPYLIYIHIALLSDKDPSHGHG